jgi:outer membrane protein assembly factor BamA
LELRYIEPWIGYSRTPGIFQLAYEQHQPLNSGSFDLWQASFDIRHEFKNFHTLSGALSVKYVDEKSEEEIDSLLAEKYATNQSEIYSATVYWKRDNRINIFYPLNSSHTDVSLTFSYSIGKVENSAKQTNNYFTLVSSWQRYQPYKPQIFGFKRWNFTMASRIKGGSILEVGEKKQIPVNERFYLGGAATVRGYQERLLGPALQTDENGKIEKAAGGKMMFVANMEVRMPVIWIVVLEVFVDGGYVWAELEDVNPVDIKFTTGAGLAFVTPLGPIRFDYGYKLMKVEQDPTPDAFHLGIYFAF